MTQPPPLSLSAPIVLQLTEGVGAALVGRLSSPIAAAVLLRLGEEEDTGAKAEGA